MEKVNNYQDNLVSIFDVYTCSGENVCDIFYNEEKIIIKFYNIWVNSNKAIWQGRVIEIPFNDLPRETINLKFMCIDITKEDRVLIQN